MRKLPPLMLSLLVLAAAAIEPPQSPPGTPPKDAPAQPETPAPAPNPGAEPEGASAPAADTGEAEAEEELPPLPPDVAPAGPSPQRFNPTEKVRADFPVSFPIDI